MDLATLSKALGKINIFLGTIDTEIGELAIFTLRVKGLRRLSDLLGGSSITDFNPNSYIRILMQVVVYPADLVIDREEPEDTPISAQQAEQLSDESLNKFSELFLQHHKYLYTERITKRKEENDKVTISFEEGDVIHRREDDESAYEYLYRLLVIEKEAQVERSKKLMDGIPTPAMLSKDLLSQFQMTSMMGASLGDSLEHIKSYSSVADSVGKAFSPLSTTIAGLRRPEVDSAAIKPLTTIPEEFLNPPDKLQPSTSLSDLLAEQHREKEQRLLKQEQLSERQEKHLEAIVDSMWQSVEYMRSLDDNQRQAAAENQKASEEGAKVARKSVDIARSGITLAKWGIALNVVVLTLTAFSVWLSWYLNSSGEEAAQNEIKVVSEGFNELSRSFSELAGAVDSVNTKQNISEKALAISEENIALRILVQQQSEKLVELENDQAKIQEQLNLLQKPQNQITP